MWPYFHEILIIICKLQGALYGDQPRMIQAQVNNNNKQGKDIHTFLSDLSSASATTNNNSEQKWDM